MYLIKYCGDYYTFLADQAGKNGTFAESALDQVYHNVSEKEEITKKTAHLIIIH